MRRAGTILGKFAFRGAAALLACWSLAFHPALAEPEAKIDAPAEPKAVVQDYEPRPALWLAEDEDTKIYMFGTIHMLPPGFKWRSPALDAAAKEADELVVETYSAPGEDDAFGAEIMPLIVLDEPRPVLERVPEEHREALKRKLEEAELPLEDMAELRTWMVAMTVGISELLGEWGAETPDEVPGVEDGLEADFRAAGKPILSIEKAQDSLAHLNALTEEQQVQLLVEAAGEGQEPGDAEDEAAADHHWAQGDLAKVDEWMWKDFPKPLYEGLVVKRNTAWTEWLAERMKKPGVLLLAVGAGHLTGADSVQKMLERRGIEAKRVQ